MFGRIVIILSLAAILIGYQNCKNQIRASTAYEMEMNSVKAGVKKASWTSSQDQAMTIYQRLSSKVSLDHPDILKMQKFIEEGNLKEAAKVAVESDNFYNITIRDFAAKMSNREQSSAVPLNDFIATFIGVARDNIDARELLQGNFYYSALPSNAPMGTIKSDIIKTNTHYKQLDESFANFRTVLTKKDRQFVIGDSGNPEELDDAAGVLTSRAFMSAHAAGGTNRRLVEFAFSQFLCSEIEEWADTSLSDAYVGREVGRVPAELYQNKCRGCHAPMDALRPAFAHVNFIMREENSTFVGFTEYKKVTPLDPNPNNADVIDVPVPANEQLVPSKFRRGKDAYPSGRIVLNNNWENLTNDGLGWRSVANTGSGLRAFGKMLAESRAFSKCMVKRAFKTVCYEKFPAERTDLLDQLADNFESNNYSLKELFANVAIQDICTGEEK